METEIFYFSGTGNSLYVANQIKLKLGNADVVSIIKQLKLNEIRSTGKIVGVVFPVHALTIPIAVRKFLRKIDLSSAQYIFVVATRLGIVFNDFKGIDSLISKKGHNIDSFFLVNMYSNDSKDKHYKTPTSFEISEIEKKVMIQVDEIANIIKKRKTCINNDNTYLISHPYGKIRNAILEKMVIGLLKLSEKIGGVNYFYNDDKCTGCGICEKVCLSEKIKMEKKMPFWQKNIVCYMCYACLNYCPAHSVQIKDIPGVKSYTKYVGRYNHPYANIAQIANQK
jgi:NAD-dependent dihydropyrimidine dehydrogenase PreA subunit